MTAPSVPQPAPRGPGRRVARWLGFVIGLALLVAAVWMAIAQAGSDEAVWDSITHAPLWLFGAATALTLLTLASTALSFWIITRRYGHVGYGEMFALIGAAWLLNYLPFRPGLFGRIAYHRSVNDISLRDSALALIWANVLSAVAAIALAFSIAVLGGMLGAGIGLITVLAILPIPVLFALAAYARAKRPEPDPDVWRLIAALACRYLELLVWAGRYWVCFQIIDLAISWPAALAIASATTLSTMVPLFGNGLGIREWTVGIVASLLPAGMVAIGTDAAAGLMADLVNRAIEVVVAVPLGIGAGFWLAARRRARRGRLVVEDTGGKATGLSTESEGA